ncbi:Hypothetical protein RAK1035_1437 [Roseovarius sp. AK1035]|nr:Hypothetical protein RAK1035_1437 [Roseovarius sp. AK1035]
MSSGETAARSTGRGLARQRLWLPLYPCQIGVTPRRRATPQNRQAGGRPGDRAAPSVLFARGNCNTTWIKPQLLWSRLGTNSFSLHERRLGMTAQSAKEVEQARIDSLGPDFGPLFRHIETDLYSLRTLWRIYVSFFGTSKERVELLNKTSGLTAFVLEKTLFESALMALCRMTDPPNARGGKNTNTTIRRFSSFLTDHAAKESLENLITDAVEAVRFARSWRDKKIAHSDYDVRVKQATLDHASQRKVSDAIDAIAAVVRWVGHECLNTDLVTHPIHRRSNDEVQFIKHIFLGQLKENELEEQHRFLTKSGEYEKAKQLSTLPDWVTYRPPERMDG